MTENEVLRYLYLVDRRITILMDSGVNWKPEYGPELEAIDRELSVLRELVDAEHQRQEQRAGGKEIDT